MTIKETSTKDLLPALSLSLPLSIDFHFEVSRQDDCEDVELHPLRVSTGDDNALDSPSSPLFDASQFLEFSTIEFDNMTPTPSDTTQSDSETALTPTSWHSTNLSMPSNPLDWIWICHLCHNRYPIGATRRCLVDGHYYCSGQATNQRNVKRKKRGISCSSEFDYVGWKQWGAWRRGVLSSRQQHSQTSWNKTSSGGGMSGGSTHGLKGCENCEYPSACRYEKMNLSTEESHVVLNEAISPTSPPDDSKNQLLDVDVEMTGTDNFSMPMVLASEPIESSILTTAQTTVLQPIPTVSLTTVAQSLEVAADGDMETENSFRVQSKNEIVETFSEQRAKCLTDARQSLVDGNPVVETGSSVHDQGSNTSSRNSNAGTPTGGNDSRNRMTERYYSRFQEAVDDSCPDSLHSEDENAFKKKEKNTRTDKESKTSASGSRLALLQYMASIEESQSLDGGTSQGSRNSGIRQQAREDGRKESSKKTRDRSQILINELFGTGNK